MSISNLLSGSKKSWQNIEVDGLVYPYESYLVDFNTGTTASITTTTPSGRINLRNLGQVVNNGTATVTMSNSGISFPNAIVLCTKQAKSDDTGRLLTLDLNNIVAGQCVFNLTNTSGGPLDSPDLNDFATIDYVILNRS